MSRNHNHDDDDDDDDNSSSSSSSKMFKNFDHNGMASWSDVNHDVLFLVMMKLGVVDFIAFSGVCKSWRSFTVSNRNTFMASKPPMKICIEPPDNKEDCYCCLEDFKERSFKTIVPHSSGRECVGLTCGYLVFFGRKTNDFWLVNPITRHEFHFPDFPLQVSGCDRIKVILVFSPSISGWVFVMLHRKLSPYSTGKGKLYFYIAGKRDWNHISSILPIVDLHVFKGKIYTLQTDCSLGELRLNLNSKWKGELRLLKTKNCPKLGLSFPQLVSSNEKLYVINWVSRPKKVMELDFGEMKWVLPEKTIEEYAFFYSYLKYSAAFKLELWAQTQHTSYEYFLDDEKSRKCILYYERMWYFPHDCLNVNFLDES